VCSDGAVALIGAQATLHGRAAAGSARRAPGCAHPWRRRADQAAGGGHRPPDPASRTGGPPRSRAHGHPSGGGVECGHVPIAQVSRARGGNQPRIARSRVAPTAIRLAVASGVARRCAFLHATGDGGPDVKSSFTSTGHNRSHPVGYGGEPSARLSWRGRADFHHGTYRTILADRRLKKVNRRTLDPSAQQIPAGRSGRTDIPCMKAPWH
jgi:hypothetical protein